MKRKSNLKQATVLVMAYILVVGFAGTSGLVGGQVDASDGSDVTLTAKDIDADIELTNLTIESDREYNGSVSETHEIIYENETGIHLDSQSVTEPEWIDNITVEVNVSVAQGYEVGTYINNATVEVWTETGLAERHDNLLPDSESPETGEAVYEEKDGDAHNWYAVYWGEDEFSGVTDNYTIQNYTFNINGNSDSAIHDHLLRQGGTYDNTNSWNVSASVEDTNGNTVNDDYLEAFTVNPFTWISVGNAPNSPTVAPTETAKPEDFGSPNFEFSSNGNYTLSNSTFELTNTSQSVTIGEENTSVTYNDTDDYQASEATWKGEKPTANNQSIYIFYEVYVPSGTAVGTYEDTVTHEIKLGA